MPGPSNVLDFVVQIPTTGAQVLVDSQGVPISLVVDAAHPEPIEELSPNDVFLAQGQSGPAALKNRDGTSPDLDATVISPYSLVTPPGVIRVG